MLTEFRTLAPSDTLARAVEHILAGCQQDFPVVESGSVVGVLTRGDLLAGLAKQGNSASVGDVMHRIVCTAEAGEMVESVLARLEVEDCKALPVTRSGALVGLLTTENLGEYMMIQTALSETAQRRQAKLPSATSPRETSAS